MQPSDSVKNIKKLPVVGVAAVLEQMPAVKPDAFTGTGFIPESREHLSP